MPMVKLPEEKLKPGPEPEAQNRLNAYGIEAICDDITHLKTLSQIANEQNVDVATLTRWISNNPQRLARARESRIATAWLWDERAANDLANAANNFELQKARELAHHYRWRASKINVKEYGERVEVDSIQTLNIASILIDARSRLSAPEQDVIDVTTQQVWEALPQALDPARGPVQNTPKKSRQSEPDGG